MCTILLLLKISMEGVHLKLVKYIPRTLQNPYFICGSLFGILGSVRLHKILGNQKYGWGLHTPLEMKFCYYINTEEKNSKYLIISVIRTRCRHIGTDKDYTNGDPKQALELNDMDLGFLKSSNVIIYGDMDEIMPDQDKVSGEIEPENKIKDYDMEISKGGGEDTEVDKIREFDAC